MRLGKYLAHAGIASRRGSEALVAGGRISVDGAIVLDPALDVDSRNKILVTHVSRLFKYFKSVDGEA